MIAAVHELTREQTAADDKALLALRRDLELIAW
jgi:hypothetical protein